MGSAAPYSPQFLVIGAGSRGEAYARAVNRATAGTIVAVADINPLKRDIFGRKYVWGDHQPQEGQSFDGWREYLEWETERRGDAVSMADKLRIDGVFICVLDELHAEVIQALAPLNLHILCEKPLALGLKECLSILSSLQKYPPKVFSIGHVLRYSNHNMTLRNLLLKDRVIGEIVSIEHTEPVGWWHFSHSYVRGNWRRSHEDGVGSLLTKSCHDIDFILWLLCSPSPLTGEEPHQPSSVMSSGAINQFKKSRKPKLAGNATNCLTCAAEPECMYSSKKIYVENQLKGQKETGWPIKIVVPDIEDVIRSSGWDGAEQRLLETLGEDYDTSTTTKDQIAERSWYGRCVYECDNDVVDDQTVTITWDEEEVERNDDKALSYGRGPKQALFHMTYPTKAQCERRGRIYGSEGEIEYDSHTITIHSFADYSKRVIQIPKQDPEVDRSHGGGDWGLADAFVKAVVAVDAGELSVAQAQREYVGCDLEEVIRSHALVFAAEEARLGRKIVDWKTWCEAKGVGGSTAATKSAVTS